MNFVAQSLSDLLALFGGKLFDIHGQPQNGAGITLNSIRPLESATISDLSFISNTKMKTALLETQAGVILVSEKDIAAIRQVLSSNPEEERQNLVKSMPLLWQVANPYLMYAKIQQFWVQASTALSPVGVSPQALVAKSAVVSKSASVLGNASVGDGCFIGDGAVIHPGVVLLNDVVIGDRTIVYPNVSIYQETRIGADCVIHSGAVIGADGFGFANEGGEWVKIPQVGKVVIADRVEVGANTTIDRGALDDTLIGFGVKLDNQIMIAHNCTLGDNTAVAGCVGMAGSTHIGARCTIGGAAMLLGHLSIPDGTHISGASAVMSSINEAGAYTGIMPITDHKTWERNAVTLRQLAQLRKQVRHLEKKLSSS